MSPRAILDTIRNPISVSPNSKEGSIYTSPSGQVVISSEGKVITVIPSGSKSFRGSNSNK